MFFIFFFLFFFCPQDFSEMARFSFLKFSVLIENINISSFFFFHFLRIHFLSSVSSPAKKSLSSRDLRNNTNLNTQTLSDDRPTAVNLIKLLCFVLRTFRSLPEVLQQLFVYLFKLFYIK